jgi:chaperonin GroES
MRVTPLRDRVLVRRLEEGEQKVGGIIVPDTAKEKPQQGQVIAVGKGRVNHEGQRVALAVQAGDRILFGKFAQEITLGGEAYLILREEEVLAVLGGGRPTASQATTTASIKTTPKASLKRNPKPTTKTKARKKGSKKTKKK